jgi:prepilin-type N-terminal cleavage/methylation domain-containing protein
VEGTQTMLKHIRARAAWSERSVAAKGFTLIELLVVITILGILAVVGVLAFGGITDTAKNATARTERTQIQTAVDAYLSKPGHATAPTSGDIAALKTDNDLKASFDTVTDPRQCDYTWTPAGDVSFAAVQADPQCKP